MWPQTLKTIINNESVWLSGRWRRLLNFQTVWNGYRGKATILQSSHRPVCSAHPFHRLCLLQVKVTQELKNTHAEQLTRLHFKHQCECDLLEDMRYETHLHDVHTENGEGWWGGAEECRRWLPDDLKKCWSLLDCDVLGTQIWTLSCTKSRVWVRYSSGIKEKKSNTQWSLVFYHFFIFFFRLCLTSCSGNALLW